MLYLLSPWLIHSKLEACISHSHFAPLELFFENADLFYSILQLFLSEQLYCLAASGV